MKKLILVGCTTLLIAFSAYSQCEKKVSWLSAKSHLEDEKGNFLQAMDGSVLVETSNKEIRITLSGKDTPDLTGTITEVKCNWTEPYKNGKTVLTGELEDQSGDIKHVEMTIEAKDGKIEIVTKAKERPNQVIKMVVDKYEEK